MEEHIKLEKINDYVWRIPRSYKPGMRVSGLVYADEKLLKDIYQDKALEQVANVAFLPGIVKASLAMPDIHWGYGFPIGGVAATDIEEGGVVSPGGVGFDINCLDGNTFIVNELGYKIRIKDYENKFHQENLVCMNFHKNQSETTGIIRFLKQKPKETVFNLLTESNRCIEATSDHPFYTEDGMKKVSDLSIGSKVAVYPFEGVEYCQPSEDEIITKEKIEEIMVKLNVPQGGNGKQQLLNNLEKRGLLPLRYNSWQFSYLVKLIGYCFGDGLLYFSGKNKRGTACFYGKKEDMEEIQKDLLKIGFRSSIYSRHREHKIKTMYDTVEFETTEFWLKVSSRSFSVLLAALGMPVGNKCRQSYGLPDWLFNAALWQKRLFLAGLFGAELSSPKSVSGHKFTFYAPVLSMNKTSEFTGSGEKFLSGISKLLEEFSVQTLKISSRKEFVNRDGLVSYRLRLILSNKTVSLKNLYGKISFEYNKKRKLLANVAAGYLSLKDAVVKEKKEVAALALKMYSSGNWDRQSLFGYFADSPYVNDRFLERSIYEPRSAEPRIWDEIPEFNEFLKTATRGLGTSGMIWERVCSIVPLEYGDFVYDFTVEHLHHNFIANNFVVSNCGVRMLKTGLKYEDVKDKLEDLVYALFSHVPSGVGSKGDIRVSAKEERQILVKGAKWAVENGYGCQDDLDCTEESVAIAGADPEAVSERAYERGKAQSGTLGSGNHFLEVQVIDQLYDSNLVDEFGLDLGQVVMMIHSGSRGFGYQICEDNVKNMVHCLQKYNINVPDRQLACAPVKSPEGQQYLGAMRCAANYAWANRQCLMHLARMAFEKVFGTPWQKLGMELIYDVAHNVAKIEKYNVERQEKLLCVHRKGATRAFGPDNPALPKKYQKTGQPVIIPGDMGRNSYLLTGTKKAEEETFGSACHGAGRVKSRTASSRTTNLNTLLKELESKGIIVKASGRRTIVEEAPQAYKDVNDVVHVVQAAGLARRVCRMRPLGVIKG